VNRNPIGEGLRFIWLRTVYDRRRTKRTCFCSHCAIAVIGYGTKLYEHLPIQHRRMWDPTHQLQIQAHFKVLTCDGKILATRVNPRIDQAHKRHGRIHVHLINSGMSFAFISFIQSQTYGDVD